MKDIRTIWAASQELRSYIISPINFWTFAKEVYTLEHLNVNKIKAHGYVCHFELCLSHYSRLKDKKGWGVSHMEVELAA